MIPVDLQDQICLFRRHEIILKQDLSCFRCTSCLLNQFSCHFDGTDPREYPPLGMLSCKRLQIAIDLPFDSVLVAVKDADGHHVLYRLLCHLGDLCSSLLQHAEKRLLLRITRRILCRSLG